jgi:hypothetical protein
VFEVDLVVNVLEQPDGSAERFFLVPNVSGWLGGKRAMTDDHQ